MRIKIRCKCVRQKHITIHYVNPQNLSYRMTSGGRLLWANVIPNTKRDDHEVLVLCCACYSERCGEQGYLSECLATEKRLYQKVAKELLSRLKSGKHKFGAINKGNIDWNCAVFLMDLASTMQQKMNEDQDKVQMCA
eukprot:993793_1